MPPLRSVLLAALAAQFLPWSPPALAADDARLRPPLVRLAEAVPARAAERAFTGVVAARVQSDLGFRVGGKVVERLVDVGQGVVRGQPLMRLDPRDLGLELAAREKAVQAARALAVQARADEARARQLVSDGWASRQRYDQAKAAADAAEAQLAAARAQAEVARNETGYALLVADADGTVLDTRAEPGQVVAAGQPVVILAQKGPREARVTLPETVRPALGSTARAELFGSPARHPARLRQLSDSADPASRTYEARYVLEGEAADAPLGATVTILAATGGDAGQVSVPLAALHDEGRGTGIWTVRPASSTVAFHPVTVRALTAETAIVEGLPAGVPVVALGAHLLHEGDAVRVAETRSASK